MLLVAALGVAGLVSAKGSLYRESGENFSVDSKMVGGYCYVSVYRTNLDGSQTYVGSWGGYATSDEDCQAKGRSIVAQLSIGIEPSNVVF